MDCVNINSKLMGILNELVKGRGQVVLDLDKEDMIGHEENDSWFIVGELVLKLFEMFFSSGHGARTGMR